MRDLELIGHLHGCALAAFLAAGCSSVEDTTDIVFLELTPQCRDEGRNDGGDNVGDEFGDNVSNSCPLEPPAEPLEQYIWFTPEAESIPAEELLRPLVVVPSLGSFDTPTPVELSIQLPPASTATSALFYGRKFEPKLGQEFSFVVLSDTQNYVASQQLASTFVQQVQWVLEQRVSQNIVLLDHLGDIVQDAQSAEQWQRAAPALQLLNQDAIAVGIAPGDRDSALGNDSLFPYDSSLPVTGFDERPWYGGYLGDRRDRVVFDDLNYQDRLWKNNYVLFSAGGMDFINIAIEHGLPKESQLWLDDVLFAYPERRAVVSTHEFLTTNARFANDQVRQVWERVLIKHCNVFLVLSSQDSGEYHRQEVRGEGNPLCPDDPVHMLMSNYRGRANGGNGWLRVLTFHPVENQFDVETYSPTLGGGTFEVGPDSQFSGLYNMRSKAEPWTLFAARTGIAEELVSVQWRELDKSASYQWYVDVTDGLGNTSQSEVYAFNTEQPGPPLEPSSLQAKAVGGGRIDLQWVDNAAAEDGYVILLKDPDNDNDNDNDNDTNNDTKVVSLAPDRSSYSVIDLQPATEYCFEVFATGQEQQSVGATVCAVTESRRKRDSDPELGSELDSDDK